MTVGGTGEAQLPTMDDYKQPTRDYTLPSISADTAAQLGVENKPVLLKKNIIEKNKTHHPELKMEEYNEILANTLYHSDYILQVQKQAKPNYFTFVKEDGRKVTVLEMNTNKENFEVVSFFKVDKKRIETYKNKTIREGGEILITKGDNSQGAARLSALADSNNSITKKGDIFKAQPQNELAAAREELDKASTVEEIYKAADHAFSVIEEAYGNTEEGRAEAGRMAPPAQDWDARRVELLKDIAEINQKTDANAAWAFASIERGGLIAPHKSGISAAEWNAPAAVTDKQRRLNVWKAEQILDEQLRNRYYKAFEKALGKINGLKGPQKSILLHEFNNIRYRNPRRPPSR